ASTQAEWAGDALTGLGLGFPKTSGAFIGRIAQHRPHRRALPSRDLLSRRNASFVQQTCDRADAHAIDDIVVIDHSDGVGFGIDNFVTCRRVVAFTNVTIPVRGAAEHIYLTLPCTMALAAARPFQDLRSLIFC